MNDTKLIINNNIWCFSATMDRKTRLKTLRGGVSTRPKRLKVLKEKTGAYTVVEVEDVEV